MKTPQEIAEDILLETYSDYKHYPEDYTGIYHRIKNALKEHGASEFERGNQSASVPSQAIEARTTNDVTINIPPGTKSFCIKKNKRQRNRNHCYVRTCDGCGE